MQFPPRRYRIVAGIDLGEYADIVLEHALDQAARHDAPDLHLLTVCEKRQTPAELERALWDRVHPALETFSRGRRGWRARMHVRRGKPEEQLALLAAEVRADLIVIGHFGQHQHNTPGRVLQAAPCATLVVGMPAVMDTTQCPVCDSVREHTDGARWFCDAHIGDSQVEHAMTPMTTWTDGAFEIEGANDGGEAVVRAA